MLGCSTTSSEHQNELRCNDRQYGPIPLSESWWLICTTLILIQANRWPCTCIGGATKTYLLLIGLEINEPWEEISPFSYAHRWAIKLSLLPSHSLYCWYKIIVWWQLIEYKLSVYNDMWQGSRIQGLRAEGWKGRKSKPIVWGASSNLQRG